MVAASASGAQQGAGANSGAAAAPGPQYFVPGQGWVPADQAGGAADAREEDGESGWSERSRGDARAAQRGTGEDADPDTPEARAGAPPERDGGVAAVQRTAGAGSGGRHEDDSGPDLTGRVKDGGVQAAAEPAEQAGAAKMGARSDRPGGSKSPPPDHLAESSAGPPAAAPAQGSARGGEDAGAGGRGAWQNMKFEAGGGVGLSEEEPGLAREWGRAPAAGDVVAEEVELPEHWVDPREAERLPAGASVASLRHRAAVALRAAQVSHTHGYVSDCSCVRKVLRARVKHMGG